MNENGMENCSSQLNTEKPVHQEISRAPQRKRHNRGRKRRKSSSSNCDTLLQKSVTAPTVAPESRLPVVKVTFGVDGSSTLGANVNKSDLPSSSLDRRQLVGAKRHRRRSSTKAIDYKHLKLDSSISPTGMASQEPSRFSASKKSPKKAPPVDDAKLNIGVESKARHHSGGNVHDGNAMPWKKRGAPKRRKKGGAKHRRQWRPYEQLTPDERKRLADREARRAADKQARRLRAGKPPSPPNTTQFLMDERYKNEGIVTPRVQSTAAAPAALVSSSDSALRRPGDRPESSAMVLRNSGVAVVGASVDSLEVMSSTASHSRLLVPSSITTSAGDLSLSTRSSFSEHDAIDFDCSTSNVDGDDYNEQLLADSRLELDQISRDFDETYEIMAVERLQQMRKDDLVQEMCLIQQQLQTLQQQNSTLHAENAALRRQLESSTSVTEPQSQSLSRTSSRAKLKS